MVQDEDEEALEVSDEEVVDNSSVGWFSSCMRDSLLTDSAVCRC